MTVFENWRQFGWRYEVKDEAQLIPAGYGIGYRYSDRCVAVFFPVPLNVIVRWWEMSLQYVQFGFLRRTKFERMLGEKYEEGRRHGIALGKTMGYLEYEKYLQKKIEGKESK